MKAGLDFWCVWIFNFQCSTPIHTPIVVYIILIKDSEYKDFDLRFEISVSVFGYFRFKYGYQYIQNKLRIRQWK